MRWASACLALLLSLVVLSGCDDDQAKQLREATKADLNRLMLTDDDTGSSYVVIRDDIEGVVSPCLPEDQICHVVLEPTATPGDGTVCAYVGVQWFTSVEMAHEAFETVRNAYTEAAQDPELGPKILDPDGLVDKAVASYWQHSNPVCSPPAEPAHQYGVIFQRSNLHASVNLWSIDEQSPEQVVSLARKQEKRIESVLAAD